MPRQTTQAEPAPVAADEAAPAAKSRPFGLARFTIFGRLAGDPELRFSGSGTPVTNAALAINDRAGQVHYLDVVVFGEPAKVLAQYGAKGRGIVAHGRISTRSWETQDGTRRKSVDLIADEYHFADRGRMNGAAE